MKSVKLTVGKDGSVKIETSGFTGGTCKEVTEQLKKGLGVVTQETEKPEFYEQNENTLDNTGY